MSKAFNKRIGRDLKVLRRLWDLSQQDVGKVLGLHQTAICRIEEGAQSLSAEEFIKVREWIKKQPNIFLDTFEGVK